MSEGGRAATALLAAALLAACAARLPQVSSDAATAAGDRQILVTIVNEPQLDMWRAGSTPRGYFSPGAYQASPLARRIADQLARTYRLEARSAWPIRPLNLHCVVYEIPPEVSRDEILTILAQDARVESAQPMQYFRTNASYNDPYSPLQHSIAALDLARAHRWASGRGVRIGIVDTGIDVRHKDLGGKVVATADFVGRDHSVFLSDRHGTAMAGVIAASDNNRLGIVGVSPRAALVAAKSCWHAAGADMQDAGEARCNSLTLAQGIAFVVDHGADVINLSVTGPRDPLLERLLKAAMNGGAIVVGARADGAAAAFPASVAGVIAVGAAESDAESDNDAHLLFAPGAEILTLAPDDRYDYVSGSSVAAAQVSGVAALVRELRPRMQNGDVQELLTRTAANAIAPAAGRARPLVNACAALAVLVGSTDCHSKMASGN